VDFIFGSYAAWFERCTLWCVSRGMDVNAMIAAPNTPEGSATASCSIAAA
jgi:pectin methylesterase-like acyl-CoA thioesterase